MLITLLTAGCRAAWSRAHTGTRAVNVSACLHETRRRKWEEAIGRRADKPGSIWKLTDSTRVCAVNEQNAIVIGSRNQHVHLREIVSVFTHGDMA